MVRHSGFRAFASKRNRNRWESGVPQLSQAIALIILRRVGKSYKP
ncbi:hypothetical protein MC7420_2119 [Coleofasciculus chthonoplastes PCC 7420]|uniref:Uncharacterized protein n=1 Tax=Coleofasciculus chthonoplastes PCC 7420 TaxID=118168 RepID=B4VSJ7_9CYAN|nr:hypothetical protein MC7420_2119 [Coleofasciculus chthonoplastes PCC 7420]